MPLLDPLVKARPPRGPYNRLIYRSVVEHGRLEEFARDLEAKLGEGIPRRYRSDGLLVLAHRWFDCMEDRAKLEFQTDDAGARNIVAQNVLQKPWPETVEALQKFDVACRKMVREEIFRQQEQQQQRWATDEDQTEPVRRPDQAWRDEDWDGHLREDDGRFDFNFANDAAEKLGKVIRNGGVDGEAAPSWFPRGNALLRSRLRPPLRI